MNCFRIILLLAAIALDGCSFSDREQEGGVLVSSDWLQERLDDSTLVILHVGSEELYDSIHIPGSRFLDPYLFTVSNFELNNELPSVDSILKLLNLVGVSEESRIILYYESLNFMTRTARVFYTLDYVGLGNQTFVLNGGLPGWENGLRPLTHHKNETEVAGAAGVAKLTGNDKVKIMAQELDQERWNPEFVIYDARSDEEYFGEADSTGMVATGGHVEGAYSLDYHKLLSDTVPYMFRDDETLLKEFKKAGMDPAKTAVFYCGSGVRGSMNYLVARHLGYPVRLYDGSMQEWETLKLPLTSPVLPQYED